MTKALLFLSHAGEEESAARELARRLERAGVPVWLDVERLRPGERWMESLEQALREATAFAVYVGRSGVARWVGQEVRVALDRSVTEEGFAVIPILGPGADPEELPVFLRQHQWVDLRDGLDDPEGLRELSEVVLGEDRREERIRRSLLPPDRAPFLGLRTFSEEDAFLFYGRDREVEELLAALGADPFLAVVGASGCGKSSLVRAGLLPALRRGRAPGDGAAPGGAAGASGSPLSSWRIALFRPADDPFRELAAALPDLDPELSAAERMAVGESAAGHFADGAGAAAGIERAVAALVPAGTRTLLVADQLEEVFTQTGDADARRRFLDALLTAGRLGGDRPVHVLTTLRADFYSRCWEHPDLPRRMAANQYPVERMARDQLREVIEKPLALAGVTPEPGLTDELLDDAGDEPGNLPLLEHALFQLWDQPASRRFTHEAYREMGGLAGALEHHAEAVFEGFGPEDRDLVRRLFLCLAVVGEGGAVTRRRVAKSDLLAMCGEGAEERERGGGLLARLVEQRLLTATGTSEEPGEERVEVAWVANRLGL
ncbi:MAG TPA: toll/interleukin-1 receptor domain-containing protein, partial [Thermoanaerobaculia bacterium]